MRVENVLTLLDRPKPNDHGVRCHTSVGVVVRGGQIWVEGFDEFYNEVQEVAPQVAVGGVFLEEASSVVDNPLPYSFTRRLRTPDGGGRPRARGDGPTVDCSRDTGVGEISGGGAFEGEPGGGDPDSTRRHVGVGPTELTRRKDGGRDP